MSRWCSECGQDVPEKDESLEVLEPNPEPVLPAQIQTTVYLHSSKESMYEKGQELGLRGEALNLFCYCCYEVAVLIEVNTATGTYEILAVDD